MAKSVVCEPHKNKQLTVTGSARHERKPQEIPERCGGHRRLHVGRGSASRKRSKRAAGVCRPRRRIGRPSSETAVIGTLTCVQTPEVVEGPFYYESSLERRPITEKHAGEPLRLCITLAGLIPGPRQVHAVVGCGDRCVAHGCHGPVFERRHRSSVQSIPWVRRSCAAIRSRTTRDTSSSTRSCRAGRSWRRLRRSSRQAARRTSM